MASTEQPNATPESRMSRIRPVNNLRCADRSDVQLVYAIGFHTKAFFRSRFWTIREVGLLHVLKRQLRQKVDAQIKAMSYVCLPDIRLSLPWARSALLRYRATSRNDS